MKWITFPKKKTNSYLPKSRKLSPSAKEPPWIKPLSKEEEEDKSNLSKTGNFSPICFLPWRRRRSHTAQHEHNCIEIMLIPIGFYQKKTIFRADSGTIKKKDSIFELNREKIQYESQKSRCLLKVDERQTTTKTWELKPSLYSSSRITKASLLYSLHWVLSLNLSCKN